ncbi:MAG: phosphatase PAP2 family protein [Rikenellaceae bacterium]|nr:phosphatase PAP2 family protein [Rikenellaceae bacterium]
MLERLLELDTKLFLLLNGDLGAFADAIFWFSSGNFNWVPLYLVILFFMYKKLGLRNFIWATIMIVLAVILADQICNLFKYGLKKFRPSQNPALEGMVYTLKGYRGGLYGPFSAHSATVMAISAITVRIFRNNIYTVFIYLWAALVMYSRIYLGVHFPLDLLCGGLTGYLIGIWFYRIYVKFLKDRKLDF